MTRLSRSDLEAALSFAREATAAATQPEREDGWLLERVVRLTGSDVAYYSELDPADNCFTWATHPSGLPELTEHQLQVMSDDNPFCFFVDRTGDRFFSARRLTDVVDLAAYRQTEYFEVFRTDPELQMRLPGSDDRHWCLAVQRTGRNYSDRDCMLLDALRPGLSAYESQRMSLKVRTALDALMTGSGWRDLLSPREIEVMELVAAGASNAEIAQRLWISPGTVRKHLDHIYEKLDVRNRTAAAALTWGAPSPHLVRVEVEASN